MSNDRAQFVKLLTRNYCRINSFIFCMVPNAADSEDIMQETTALMWDKFDQYKLGTNFVAWALTIARYKILSYQRDMKRNRIKFDDRVIEMIETESRARLIDTQNTTEKVAVLKKCIQKLPEKDREIVVLKYQSELPTKTIASRKKVSLPTIYRRLSKIYFNLLECINRNLSLEES